MRKYLATFDNGHDYFEVEFESEHRAGSKANAEDARWAMKQKYGWGRKGTLQSVSRYE